jgi:hypothetical protein
VIIREFAYSGLQLDATAGSISQKEAVMGLLKEFLFRCKLIPIGKPKRLFLFKIGSFGSD